MRIDARTGSDTSDFEVVLNGEILENVVAVDTDERWVVRRLTMEEVARAQARGETFMMGVQPEEIVHISESSYLLVRLRSGQIAA